MAHIRLSTCTASDLCSVVGETSIYDTYGRDWACLSARSTMTRGARTSEASDWTQLMKDGGLTESARSALSDHSTEPPQEDGAELPQETDQVPSVADSTPSTCCPTPDFPPAVHRGVGEHDALFVHSHTVQASSAHFPSEAPMVIQAKPVSHNTLAPKAAPSMVCSVAERVPLLSFRSNDSVYVFGADSSYASCSRQNSWVPPSSRSITSARCPVPPPCTPASARGDAVRNRSTCRPLSAAAIPSPTDAARRCQSLSAIRGTSQMPSCPSSATQIHVGDQSIRQREGSGNIQARGHVEGQAKVDTLCGRSHESGQGVSLRCREEPVGCQIRSCSAITHAELKNTKDGMRGTVASNRILSNAKTLLPIERHLASSSLEITRDVEGVKVGFKRGAVNDGARELTCRGSDGRERSTSTTAGARTLGVSSTAASSRWSSPLREDHTGAALRCNSARGAQPPPSERIPRQSVSWVPSPCSTAEPISQCRSWVPQPRSSSVSGLRPLHPSRVSKLGSAPAISSYTPVPTLAPTPPQRPVRSQESFAQEVTERLRRPSPPRRMVSRQLSLREFNRKIDEKEEVTERPRKPSPPRRLVSRQFSLRDFSRKMDEMEAQQGNPRLRSSMLSSMEHFDRGFPFSTTFEHFERGFAEGWEFGSQVEQGFTSISNNIWETAAATVHDAISCKDAYLIPSTA